MEELYLRWRIWRIRRTLNDDPEKRLYLPYQRTKLWLARRLLPSHYYGYPQRRSLIHSLDTQCQSLLPIDVRYLFFMAAVESETLQKL